MASHINMLDVCLDYARGGWCWGQRDCIGLMFELLRKTTGKHIKQSDYMPEGLFYKQAVDWLVNDNAYPLEPYYRLLNFDLALRHARPAEDAHLIIMYGGSPLITQTGDLYPIYPVPGIAFKPPGKLPLVFGDNGLLTTNIPVDRIEKLHRYILPGVM